MTAIKINDTRQPALRYNGVIPMHSPRALEVGQIAEILTDNGEYWADVYAPDFKTAQQRAAFIVRACNAHAELVEALTEAMEIIEAKTGGKYLKARAALQSAKE